MEARRIIADETGRPTLVLWEEYINTIEEAKKYTMYRNKCIYITENTNCKFPNLELTFRKLKTILSS